MPESKYNLDFSTQKLQISPPDGAKKPENKYLDFATRKLQISPPDGAKMPKNKYILDLSFLPILMYELYCSREAKNGVIFKMKNYSAFKIIGLISFGLF